MRWLESGCDVVAVKMCGEGELNYLACKWALILTNLKTLKSVNSVWLFKKWYRAYRAQRQYYEHLK